ncbi:MAG: calcium-binding protein, partial [Gammaproteobacteria bacterium]
GEFRSGEGTDDDDEIDLSGSGGGTAAGGDGDDTYICDDESDVPVERPGQGIDTVRASLNWTLGPSLEILELTGTGNLSGTGNASPNTLRGNSGNNTLDGAAGADTLEGGSGNDTYFVDDPNDVVLETTGTTAPGGSPIGLGGRDRSEGEDPTAIGDVADALRSSASSYVLPAGVESATLLDNAGCATLSGNAGANPVTGNAQANLLAGGAGNDSLSGGGGNDVAVFSGARSGYRVETLAGGVVRVTDIDPTNGDDGVDRLTGVEALRFADTIEGGLGKGIARGGAAANTLDLTEAGGQIAAGGAGNDIYRVNSTADAAVELANGGRDRVDSSVNWVLWDNVEDLRLTGSNALTGRGNELGNRMEGNGAANQLKGYAGDDTLFGAAGADRLEGGDGADVLRGGKGNDVLVGGAGADVFLFDAALAGNKDSVSDFVPGTDGLQLDNEVFTAFATPGALAATRFAAGANLKAARDADDR